MTNDSTARLNLPYLVEGQAMKHLTLNEALAALDGLVCAAVESRSTSLQPDAPTSGQAWLLPPDREGPDWSLFDEGALVRFDEAGWTQLRTPVGALVWDAETGGLLVRAADGWRPLADTLSALHELTALGVGTRADAANPLAAKLNAALFTARATDEGGTGDLRLVLNRDDASNALSLLFQTDYVGQAEIGMVGDDLAVKVSADGVAWREALRLHAAGGEAWIGDALAGAHDRLNLLPDSGRFTGAAGNAVFAGAPYVAPSWLEPAGGSAFSPHARFIHDNADYGGSGGALDPEVRALVDRIRPSDARRFGPEWWVLKITRGAVVVEPISMQGETFDFVASTAVTPLPARFTCGYYLRVLSGRALVRPPAGGELRADGVRSDEPRVFGVDDGWAALNLLRRANAFGYDYDPLGLRAADGAEVLIAMPRVVAGWARFPAEIGVLPNARMFG